MRLRTFDRNKVFSNTIPTEYTEVYRLVFTHTGCVKLHKKNIPYAVLSVSTRNVATVQNNTYSPLLYTYHFFCFSTVIGAFVRIHPPLDTHTICHPFELKRSSIIAYAFFEDSVLLRA